MDIEKIRAKLIEAIRATDDEVLLQEVQRMLDQSGDWADELSEEQRAGILEAEKSIREGRYVSNERFWEMKQERRAGETT